MKQLEKEFDILEKSVKGAKNAQTVHTQAQNISRAASKSLAAAQRELAAANKAVQASQKGIVAANNKVTQATKAHEDAGRRLKTVYNAQQRLSKGSIQSLAREAEAVRRLEDAKSNVKIRKIDQRRAQKAVDTYEGPAAGRKFLQDNLEKANQRLMQSERALAKARKGSVQSIAAQKNAAEQLRIKTEHLQAAQRDLATKEAVLKAAHDAVTEATLAQAAADQRLVAASSQVAAAQAKAAAASTALSTAQGAAAVSATRSGRELGDGITRGTKRAEKGMLDLASRSQWLGRQLQTNFTLPIAVAGGFAVKFALDNERAFTRLSKVYGDFDLPEEIQVQELEALRKAFRALSEEFGVNQAEVLGIAADWAAAGASGIALARSVENTLKTMVLGEIEAAEATEALIAIQAQYNLSSKELTRTIEQMNMVENQTGASMSDLIEGMERAAGAAASAGVPMEELLAGMAALVPAAGSAANAGNALKTIYTRIVAPTHDAIQLLEQAGIEVSSMGWKTLGAADRMKILAERMDTLSDSQKRFLARTVFGIYQIGRADIYTRALTDALSFYKRGLDAATDTAAAHKQAQIELQTVLASDPQRVKRLGVIYQNMAADIGQQLVPAVILAGTVIADVANKFNDLDSITQKTIITALLFIAVVGPLVRWAAGIVVLFGAVGRGIMMIGGAFASVGGIIMAIFLGPFKIISSVLLGIVAGVKAVIGAFVGLKAMGGIFAGIAALIRMNLGKIGLFLLGWPALLIGAITAVIAIFHEQISQAFSVVWNSIKDNLSAFGPVFAPLVGFFNKIADGIVGAFYKLPKGIQGAMLAVIDIVKQAVLVVYELFSYLNPFARHSPSLVENVVEGMSVIRDEFATITSIGDPIEKAYQDIEKFKNATRSMMKSLDSFKRAEDLKTLLSIAPGASDEFLELVRDLQKMQPVMSRLEVSMNRQQKVVDEWERRVESLNRKLDKEREKLEDLREVADEWADKLQEAEDRLSDFASRPLQGMGAMEDQIFANTMAQKALQLQMMEMEDAIGPIDDLQSKLSALAGEIEFLRGEQTSLREAGAGSEILGVYDQQISALEDQQQAINNTTSDYNTLQSELEALQRAGAKLDLQKSLNFDGLERDINKAAKAVEEMPFDQIMAGIQQAQADIALYGDKVDQANKRVKEQQEVVDALADRLDAVQQRYDLEKEKLDAITDRYNKWRDAIQEVKSALDDVGQAASEAVEKGMKKKKGAGGGAVDPAVQDFLDAAGGDFENVMGSGGAIGREGGLGNQTSLIDEFTKEVEQRQKDLAAKLDIFKPIKVKWAEFKTWWRGAVTPAVSGLMDDLSAGFGDIDWDAPFKTAEGADTSLTKFFKGTGDAVKGFGTALSKFWDLVGPDVEKIVQVLGQKLKKAVETLAPTFVKLGKSLADFWKAIEPLVLFLGGVALAAIKVFASMLAETLGPILDTIIHGVNGILLVLSGLIQFVSGIFNNDWRQVWEGVKQIFEGVWNLIIAFYQRFIGQWLGMIEGLVKGIVGFFQWLYDILVGNSIIPDMCNAIINWFLGLPGKILGALAALGGKLVDLIKAAWAMFMDALKAAWNGTFEFIKGLPQKMFDGFMLYIGLYKSIGTKIIGFLKEGLVNAWEGVSGWIGDKVSWVVDKFGGIKNSLAGKFSGMFDGIKEAFKSAVNFIIDGWNNLEFFIGIPEKVFGVPVPGGGKGISIPTPNIPRLAKGGVAQSQMMHLVGERGPELFIPGTTGRVTSNNDIATLMATATKDALSSLIGPGVATAFSGTSPAKLGMIAAAADRRVATATAAPGGDAGIQAHTINNNTEYHFHGDLSFPNIKSGEDAEKFLTNLSDLAG